MTMSVNGTGRHRSDQTVLPSHVAQNGHPGLNGHDAKAQRQRAIRDLIQSRPIGSQREVVAALGAQGFEVTQATVSRDISELGLVKAPGADGHVYVTPERMAPSMSGWNRSQSGVSEVAAWSQGTPSSHRLRGSFS